MPDRCDLADVPEQLTSCRQPLLIGVRHHSVAMAKAVPRLLEQFAPQVILLELPVEFAEWLPWLGHADTVAPVALAGCRSDGVDLCFYPFADFSPELAAVRWAFQNDVPVVPFDLPISARKFRSERQERTPRGLLEQLLRRTDAVDTSQLWDRLIESPAHASSDEQIRAAALLFGWALRWNDDGPSAYDWRREHYMRGRIADHSGSRCAAVVGAYHAAALLPEPELWEAASNAGETLKGDLQPELSVATAMIPYAFEQLDERSGYPAGIRDPNWHQTMYAAASLADMEHGVVDLVVRICRELRLTGHPMNAADAQEVVRVARDLARLRRFAVPGRQEVMEALQLCLTQGQIFGAGRAVAAAMHTVLVGQRSGQLPLDLPRCGLAPDIEATLRQLKLPGPESLGTEKRMRLDSLRNPLERAREVVFHRLQTCHIPYASPAVDGSTGDRESLTSVWTVKWENATAAMIALSSAKGATLAQAAEGILRMSLTTDRHDWGINELQTFRQAAECGFGALVSEGLEWLTGPFSLTASLAKLTTALNFLDRIVSGHIPGLPTAADAFLKEFCQPFAIPDGLNSATLLQSAIDRLSGLHGSEDEADVAAMLDLVLWFQQQDDVAAIDAGRLLHILRQFAANGAPLMQGAAAGALLLLDQWHSADYQACTGSWLDAATTGEARRHLQLRLRGTLRIVQPRLYSDIDCLNGVDHRVAALEDHDFMQRLPVMRKGFDVLSASGRRLLLRQFRERHCGRTDVANRTEFTPEQRQLWFQADDAARQAVAALLPDLVLITDMGSIVPAALKPHRPADRLSVIPTYERWQLLLGEPPADRSSAAGLAAKALDELYGHGSGEGSRGSLAGRGGGDEAPYPGAREWAADLTELFSADVREEVLVAALQQGRGAVLSMINEDSVRPSVELLEQVLSLRGGLPVTQTEKLRRLAKRITDQLSRQLATRMAPALTGLSTPRPTRRPTSRLDLRRTINANLKTVQFNHEGKPQLVPENFFFKTPARRSMDWHIIYVVDVSGSMEPSVIYSALTAAIFSGLPALSVSFLAFSTQVVDFTGRVDDPLAMLMEVQVGGGTMISLGLRAARKKMKVPSRTIVLLITDFEEGASLSALLAEVQLLVNSGARVLGLAALSDDGKPRYHTGIASQVAACGMPVAALSPGELARWVGEQIR